MKTIKRIFCLIANYLPPKLNCYFYKLSGVKLNISKVWVGNKCYFDTQYPENITLKDNVCVSYGVTILCHFDASESNEKHPLKKYKKKTILEEGVFVGAKAIIMPGVTVRRNTFVQAGTVLTKSTIENSFVYGNPQKTRGLLTKKIISRINNQNKNFYF